MNKNSSFMQTAFSAHTFNFYYFTGVVRFFAYRFFAHGLACRSFRLHRIPPPVSC